MVDRLVDRGVRRMQEAGVEPLRLGIFFLEVATHDSPGNR